MQMSKQQGLQAAIIKPLPANGRTLARPSAADLIHEQLVVSIKNGSESVSESGGGAMICAHPGCGAEIIANSKTGPIASR